MPNVFKRRIWIDANGVQCSKTTPGAKAKILPDWYFRVMTSTGRKLVRGYSDKGATVAKLNDMVKREARGEQGLVNPFESHNKAPLLDHVRQYVAELAATGHDTANNRIVELRLNKMVSACGWNRLVDVSAATFSKFRDTGDMLKAAPKTRNDYHQTARQFCRWCVRNGRMAIDPFQSLATVKSNGDVRRQRRAMTDQEVQRLLTVAPEPRRTVYQTALLTGLRRAELGQLRLDDIHLDAPKPFLTARASTTKNGKAAVIFLRDDLVSALRRLPARTDGLLFRVPKIETFYNDLRAAGIDRTDSKGRILDFHSIRHTLATNLGRAGVSIRTAMEVMRHSDARLTTKTYTDASQLPTIDAIESLPRWEVHQQVQQAVATGTDGQKVCDTICDTIYPAQLGVCTHSDARLTVNATDDQTTVIQGENLQNKLFPATPNTMRPLGIEPRTHRLKVCCSTS